jgi:hypothetical protein
MYHFQTKRLVANVKGTRMARKFITRQQCTQVDSFFTVVTVDAELLDFFVHMPNQRPCTQTWKDDSLPIKPFKFFVMEMDSVKATLLFSNVCYKITVVGMQICTIRSEQEL